MKLKDGWKWHEYDSGSLNQKAHQLRDADYSEVGGIAYIKGVWHQLKYDEERSTEYTREDWQPIKARSKEEAKVVALTIWRML